MKTYEVLEKAKALIANPENWTQGEFARRADGEDVYSKSPDACKWCSIGAILNVVDDNETYDAAYQYLFAAMNMPVAQYNDILSHEEVIQAWDRAIEQAKRQDA